MRKRRLLTVFALVLIGGSLAVVWMALDWPPPRLLLKYGLPPAGGPTGSTVRIAGMKFVEIQPGYCKVSSDWSCRHDDRLFPALKSLLVALRLRDAPYRVSPKPYWAEIPRGFWLQERTLPPAVYEQCLSDLGEDLEVLTGAVVWELRPTALSTWLSRKLGARFRPPTIEEWEYAARSGTWRSVFTLTQSESLDPPIQWDGVVWNARWISPAVLDRADPWVVFESGRIEISGGGPYRYSAKTGLEYHFRLVWTPHR